MAFKPAIPGRFNAPLFGKVLLVTGPCRSLPDGPLWPFLKKREFTDGEKRPGGYRGPAGASVSRPPAYK
jgi:hypothetical protein